MDTRKNRTSIAKLRSSDANLLQVLAQEAFSVPLRQIEPGTVVDLIALSELTDGQLPTAFVRDLQQFRSRMFDQIKDLPDGAELAGFVSELSELPPEDVSQTLREFLAELLTLRSHPDSLEQLQRIAEAVSDTPPQEISLPQVVAAPASSAASTSSARKTSARKTSAKKTTKKRTTRISASQVDDRRAEWIEEDVLHRLANYGARGLKESIILAGTQHRARTSWSDLSQAEVLAVLRRLKRESKVRFSAGRWMIQN